MGSKDKFYSINSRSHGVDIVGFNAKSGVVSSVADAAAYGNGRYAGFAMMTMSAPHALLKGQPINIGGTTDYDGVTRILYVVSTTILIVNKPFTVTKPGTWDQKGGSGAWDAFRPIGGDMPIANLTLAFFDTNQDGGNQAFTGETFKQDQLYIFPGVIKTVLVATSGNLEMVRAASLKQKGIPAP